MSELKQQLGWLRPGTYCFRCAVRDGWAQAEVIPVSVVDYYHWSNRIFRELLGQY